MATGSGTQSQTTPDTHTYTLLLKSYEGRGEPLHVEIKDKDMFWDGVRLNDQVRFVPDPKLTGATVRIKFVPEDKVTFPLGQETISSTGFYTVVNETRDFKAECFVITADGKEHGYPQDDGGHPCSGGCAPPR
jgi:hypothetical protein